MERKKFLKSAFIASGAIATGLTAKAIVENNNDELSPIQSIKDPNLGFNHIPHSNSTIKMNTVLHKSDSRGHADHGWLVSKHTFSFANYYNPDRMHFGVLRVLNDDYVAPGMGFGTHPHDNMEIISIPLDGDLEHKDSMGNVAVIKKGDIQVMSAGTGITHSEYNKNKDKAVKFLQIWVFPNKRNVTPRYDQISLNLADRENRFQQILSPNSDDEGVWIHQNAWFHLGKFQTGKTASYQIKSAANGLYVFMLKGKAKINGIEVAARDGLGIWNTQESIQFEASEDNEILLMDVPMNLS
jgi:quercetin 2,3-dioxygenase